MRGGSLRAPGQQPGRPTRCCKSFAGADQPDGGLCDRLAERGGALMPAEAELKPWGETLNGVRQDVRMLTADVKGVRNRWVRRETSREADLARLEAEMARFRAEVERAE